MRTATLIEPYLGYRNIILIKKWDTKWELDYGEVEERVSGGYLVRTDKIYEDEFIEDK